jgi:hypothetical protein
MKKYIFILIITITFIILLLHGYAANAEIKTITATHTYKMGDNDSRNEARRICFLEAKRSVLEKAGTYIESRTEIKNYKLSRDEVSAYSAALLTVETVNEKWEDMSITIDVKATVDTDYISKQMAKIKKDTSVQNEIKGQQERILELERAVASMQEKLKSANVTDAEPLKKERNVVVKQIDTLEAKKIEIVERIHKKTLNARTLTTIGMSENDVRSLLGEPDGKSGAYCNRRHYVTVWYYGHTKVCFNTAGLVEVVD